MRQNSNRLLIIGLDGLCWPLVERLIEAGTVPNLARLRQEGAWGPLTSVVPTQSASAWASFITGQNPARHGVFDFTVRQHDGTHRHAKPHRAATLWHHLGRRGVRVGVINFPITYPPDPVNGFLVSGMLSPKGRTFTYPPELGDEILSSVPGYRLDLEWQLYKGRERALLRDLAEMTQHRVDAVRYLRDRYDPDCLAVAFIGSDRLQHALWRHLDPTHPTHDPAQAASLAKPLYGFYAILDDAVGHLVAGAGEGTTVFILSDHGFQSAVWQFRVNEWLAEQGWLSWQSGRSRLDRLGRRLDTPWVRHLRRRLVKDISQHFSTFAPGGTVDWSRTKAFNPWNSQQGVRLNVQDREPRGIVAVGADYERLRDDIHQALVEAAEPRTGRLVVDKVWRREDLYGESYFGAVPDLVFTLRPGFASSPMQPGLWTETGWGSGDHSLEGMFIAWGQGTASGRMAGARLIDVAPTALYLLGQAVPGDMDGKVMVNALDPALVAYNPVCREEGSVPLEKAIPEGEALTTEEEAEVRARLRGLGYL